MTGKKQKSDVLRYLPSFAGKMVWNVVWNTSHLTKKHCYVIHSLGQHSCTVWWWHLQQCIFCSCISPTTCWQAYCSYRPPLGSFFCAERNPVEFRGKPEYGIKDLCLHSLSQLCSGGMCSQECLCSSGSYVLYYMSKAETQHCRVTI